MTAEEEGKQNKNNKRWQLPLNPARTSPENMAAPTEQQASIERWLLSPSLLAAFENSGGLKLDRNATSANAPTSFETCAVVAASFVGLLPPATANSRLFPACDWTQTWRSTRCWKCFKVTVLVFFPTPLLHRKSYLSVKSFVPLPLAKSVMFANYGTHDT